MDRELHPHLTTEERRRLFHEGLDLFNRQEFYACHEAFEEIWRSRTPEPKDLFQGLIQIAVGFFHFEVRARPHVARRVLAKGRKRLAGFSPASHGLDIARLLRQVEPWDRWLAAPSATPPPHPRIHVLNALDIR